MRFINLTPHNINVYNHKGNEVVISIPTHEMFKELYLRVDELPKGEFTVDGIPVSVVEQDATKMNKALRKLDNELEKGTVVIVSLAVLSNVNFKPENIVLVAPDTFKGAVRDENGRILGVKSFRTLANLV